MKKIKNLNHLLKKIKYMKIPKNKNIKEIIRFLREENFFQILREAKNKKTLMILN